MEIDTGAGVSLVSEETVNSPVMKKLPLQPTDVRLRTYTGETVPVLTKLMVSVVKDEASMTLPLLVVKGGGTTLLGTVGRDWLHVVFITYIMCACAFFELMITFTKMAIAVYHMAPNVGHELNQ